MQRLIYLIITIITLCSFICSCDVQESSSKNNSSGQESEQDTPSTEPEVPSTESEVPSTDNQVLKQISRRIMVNSSEIGEKTETKQYDENGTLLYYTKFDYTNFDKEQKNGVVTANIYDDEAGKNKVGTAKYTFDKVKKTMLMEVFCEGEDIADAAEYFEYLDENFEWYTRFCQYLPAENNKITYYRTATFTEGTFDYTTETDYVSLRLTWDAGNCEPVGDLKILEEITCEYNDVAIPGTDNKQHQWVKEIRKVNAYNPENGNEMSQRRFQYDFFWNENICQNDHIQQNSFELNLTDDTVTSINDIVMKSFQKYGNEYKLKRKTWLSAEGENKYYYEYEYALLPESNSKYYLTSTELIDNSGDKRIIKSADKYLQYKNDDGKLIYEEIKLQAETSRSMNIDNLCLSLAPKRYRRGR